jgi:uracil-DNA glycosylase family 4
VEKRRAYRDCDYWSRPVPNFGDPRASLVIVGLAPGAHGANRTGRLFTGDRSGDWLFRALHKAGFANQPTAVSRADGLILKGCAITAVCHCAPPDNRPTTPEVANCHPWLTQTVDLLDAQGYVALGHVAWKAMVAQARQRQWLREGPTRFAHAAELPLHGSRWLLGSYHPSQQNTFTGRLTEAMFDRVFRRAKARLRT